MLNKKIDKHFELILLALAAGLIVIIMPTITSATTITLGGGGEEIDFADTDVCKPERIYVPRILRDAPDVGVEEFSTNIEADEIQMKKDTKILILTGNAQFFKGNRGGFADRITYDHESYKVTAEGNVKFYTSSGDEISTEFLQLEVDTFIGQAKNVQIKIADNSPKYTERASHNFREEYYIFDPIIKKIVPEELQDIGGKKPKETLLKEMAYADIIDFEGKYFERLTNATIYTCARGDDDILLVAREIELDHAEGVGTAQSMTVKFKGIPIFYFPRATFPINHERKTGFLLPTIGYENKSGYIMEVPYYINIGPQHDTVIIPRILSNRGAQLFSEYRYLTENSKGSFKAEILPSDRIFDDDRYAIEFDHHQGKKNWRAMINFQDISDSAYFRDFSNEVDVVVSSYVEQEAKLVYSSRLLRFEAELSAHESINDNIRLSNQPYERLPELSLDIKSQEIDIFNAGLDSEYTNFDHDYSSNVTGSRLTIKPYISLPLKNVYGYANPKVSVQSISYSLDNNPTVTDDSPSIRVPIFSVDSGLFFEKLFKYKATNYLQTLEPRLYYVNIPYAIGQESFPNFDSGGGSASSFGHFFRENRFFGGDRIGDTHQVSAGLISRIVNDDSGEEKFILKIGQVFFFEDRKVGLTANTPSETSSISDFLLETSANLNKDWSLHGFTRWSEEESDIEFIQFSVEYDHSKRRKDSVSYTLNKNFDAQTKDEQISFEIKTPLAPGWQLETGVDYSISDSATRSAELGVSFDRCCWAIKLGAQRFLDGTGGYDNRFLFMFELDNLGRVSSQL